MSEEQVNIGNHNKTEFEAMVNNAFLSGGMGLTAIKSWGKSRFLFSCCRYLRSQGIKTMIFDVSDAWLYGFDQIPVFNITDNDITIQEQKQSIDMEQFSFSNWQLIKLAICNEKDLLIRLKTKSQSKRGFAIRSIINYLDDLQRAEKEQSPTHENSQKRAYFIEEFGTCINNRLTSRIDCESFLSCFNEARNFSEAFFTCQQYDQDSAKTLRVKQITALGKLTEAQKMSYHHKLERIYKVNLSDMKPRTWLIDGQIITAPTWKQSGKPYIINSIIREKWFNSLPKPEMQPKPKEKKSRLKKAYELIFCTPLMPTKYNQQSQQLKDETSEYDGVMTLSEQDSLLPPEEF